MNQALNKRESISGVNLDEEAANLIKFQQAYEASAQIINVANTLFQTLINTLR
jgi:flagellar hook-associated protein 1 FlgK